MPPETPHRGRCFTPAALHDISARKRPARAAELPDTATTHPDDLLPARLETRRPAADAALADTRLDGLRYRSFVSKLAEEVVVQDWDTRIEPASQPPPDSTSVKRRTVPLRTAPKGQVAPTLPSVVDPAASTRSRRSG